MARILDDLDDVFREESWPKACGCGHSISEEEWERMHYVGVQKSEFEDIPDLELRGCPNCFSTLAITVPRDFVTI